MAVVKKRNYSDKVLNKPVSTTWVYYTTGDGKVHQISLKTLIRRLNKISYTKQWYQTIRQAQQSLTKK